MTRPALALLSGARLRHNLELARQAAPGARVYGVVKADAYGHGLPDVTRRLVDAGVDGVAVACLEEAQAVRHEHRRIPVLLLEGAVDAHEAHHACALGLDVVVHCAEQLQPLLEAGESPARIWLKHDSGMHRLGLSAPACIDAWHALAKALPSASVGLMTHFASADELDEDFTHTQLRRFEALRDELAVEIVSTSNSAAVLRGLGVGSQWLRPGLMLYGLSPFGEAATGAPEAAASLQPVMQFVSQVISVLHVRAGETVGYGRAWRAERDSRIAVVACGYGDGYPRHAPNGTPLLVNGVTAPLAGRVSMDMLSVDVTDVPTVTRGDPVVLWGDGLPAERVARHCGTIAYELVCKLTARVPRRWLD